MTALSIYKSALLPEIIDYCHTFLSSLFENASSTCNLENLVSQTEINSSIDQVIYWLQRCLTAPLTQISETSFRSIEDNLLDITSQFTQRLNEATDSGISPATNPLAQHRLMDAIEKILLNNCSSEIGYLFREIEIHFCTSAKSFYQHLNRLCNSCLSPVNMAEPLAPPQPLFSLDETTVFSCKQSVASSYSDTEAAIEEVKSFFETHIFSDTDSSFFYSLCKKMYIPVLNSVISDPESFLEAQSQHPIRDILSAIKNIGLYARSIKNPEENAMLNEVAISINNFIEVSMTNSGRIHKPLSKLNRLAKQCKKRLDAKQKKQKLSLPAITANTALDSIDPISSATGSQIAANATHNDNSSDDVGTKFEGNLQPDTPQPQAKAADKKASKVDIANQYIEAIISGSNTRNSLTENLRKQWQMTLTFIAKVHGVGSNEWQHALKLAVELTKQSSAEAISVAKAKQVDSLFRFAGVKSEIISVRTLAPPIDAKYATILKEGKWFDLDNNGSITRCKLAGIIKQIGRYIFISRQGQKVFEVDFNGVTEALDSGKLKPKNDVSLSNTLEDILSNIKNASLKDFEHKEFS